MEATTDQAAISSQDSWRKRREKWHASAGSSQDALPASSPTGQALQGSDGSLYGDVRLDQKEGTETQPVDPEDNWASAVPEVMSVRGENEESPPDPVEATPSALHMPPPQDGDEPWTAIQMPPPQDGEGLWTGVEPWRATTTAAQPGGIQNRRQDVEQVE